MSASSASSEAIRAVGGDPTTHEWEWVASAGPHGRTFSWSQQRQSPPGYVGIEHLERVLQEREQQSEGFLLRVRDCVAMALQSEDEDLLRRAIQVSAALGFAAALPRIRMLAADSRTLVASDARASAFLLNAKLRRTSHNDA